MRYILALCCVLYNPRTVDYRKALMMTPKFKNYNLLYPNALLFSLIYQSSQGNWKNTIELISHCIPLKESTGADWGHRADIARSNGSCMPGQSQLFIDLNKYEPCRLVFFRFQQQTRKRYGILGDLLIGVDRLGHIHHKWFCSLVDCSKDRLDSVQKSNHFGSLAVHP